MSKTVQQQVKRFWQKQMRLDELTQPGWGDVVDYFCIRDMMYSTSELRVAAVITMQMYDDSDSRNTRRFTLSSNQSKPLMTSGLIKTRMNKDLLRMRIRITTQGNKVTFLFSALER
jgi:hypothetical protein